MREGEQMRDVRESLGDADAREKHVQGEQVRDVRESFGDADARENHVQVEQMTGVREVRVRVRGVQGFSEMHGNKPQDAVETCASGSYFCKDGTHYIRYEEFAKGTAGRTVNFVKLSGQGMEVTKRGLINTRLVFRVHEKTAADYQTMYGTLRFGIATNDMQVTKENGAGEGEGLAVDVRYALDANGAHLADCRLRIWVTPAHGRQTGGKSPHR